MKVQKSQDHQEECEYESVCDTSSITYNSERKLTSFLIKVMKFSISSILLTTFIVAFVELNEAHYNVNLIKNIHHKYMTTGVIILLGTDYPSFEKITIYHEAVRLLSSEGISTLISNFKQLEDKVKVGNKRIAHPLIVITIDTIEEFHTLQSICENLDMSFGVWLIIFTRNSSQDVCEFCGKPHKSSLNLKFDSKVIISCCDSDMIEEWWNIGKNLTKNQELGRLMEGNHRIEWFSDELVKRRRYSMDGQGLRIAALKDAGEMWKEDGNYSGFWGELLAELSQAANFTVSEIIWEGNYSVFNSETLEWTGVFGRIHRREADLGPSAFLMTNERYDAVSLSSPVMATAVELYYRKHDVAYLVWNAHFKALAVDVWMVVIGLILMMPVFLTLIRYRRRRHFFPLLFEHYSHVWGIFCQQGLAEVPNELPSKMIYLSIFLSVLITLSAYSAGIISSLTIPSYPLFDTLEQLVEDGSYKIIIVQNTPPAVHEPSNPQLLNKWMALLKPHGSRPLMFTQGFKQVCSERVAFYAYDLVKNSLIDVIPCEINSIRVGSLTHVSMIMPRDSEYLDLVNYHIQRFRDNGILRRLGYKYFAGSQDMDEDILLDVKLEGIAPILVILAVGCLIASIIFIIERKYYSPFKNSEILTRLRDQRRRESCKRNAQSIHF